MWINVPIGLAAAALAPVLLDESRAASAPPSTSLGAITVTAGLTILVYALIEDIALAPLAAILIAAFVVIERRTANPLVPLTILKERNLSTAAVTGALMGGALIGLFFFTTLYLQQVLGYGPLTAGLAFLPLALTIGASAGIASKLATTRGPRPVLIAGLLIQAAGLYWFSHVSADGSYVADVLFPSLIVALGMGLAFVPLTILAMSGVRDADSGLASGVMAMAQQIGQAVGLAVLTGLAFEDAFLAAGAMALAAALVASDQRDRAHRGARPAAELQR